MAQRNVEVVSRMYEAFHGGDPEGTLATYDPQVEVDATRRPDGRRGRGHEALTEIIGEWLGAFDDWSEEIEEMRGFGSRVLVIAAQRGRGKESGVEVEARYAVLYAVAGDRITSMTLYPDPDEGLKAARGAD